jgi:CheY-like chemotaxis protein
VAKTHLILLVEDSDDDAYFFERAVGRVGLGIQTYRVCDGQAAIDYLRGVAPYTDRQKFPLPNVIMLDLNMPVCDGFDFLTWKRDQPSLACIPAIVMTSSDVDRDVRLSYELGAHSFTTKLISTDTLSSRVAALRDWWFNNCVLLAPEGVAAEPPVLALPNQRP